jgi:hypothetical protein
LLKARAQGRNCISWLPGASWPLGADLEPSIRQNGVGFLHWEGQTERRVMLHHQRHLRSPLAFGSSGFSGRAHLPFRPRGCFAREKIQFAQSTQHLHRPVDINGAPFSTALRKLRPAATQRLEKIRSTDVEKERDVGTRHVSTSRL